MMKQTLTVALILALCAILISLVYTKLPVPSSAISTAPANVHTVEIGGQTVRVDIADTPQKREKGLGGRASLLPDEGMLFVFPADGKYAFWMKDMQFPIDILWLSASSTIVDIAESISPSVYPASFLPHALARYVLELPAGFSNEYGVHVGDSVQIQ